MINRILCASLLGTVLLGSAAAAQSASLTDTTASGLPSITKVDATGAERGSYTLGALEITHPFSRATLPNAPVGGGFLTVTNTGSKDDRLVAASTEVAGHVEIHEMTNVDDVMRMRPLPDGLEIPAGETVTLEPGGYHLMFMELQEPLVDGETVEVTLTFETAGEITVPLAIGARDAPGPVGDDAEGA